MSRYIDDKWLEDNAKEYSLGYYEEDEWAIPLSLLEEAPSIDIVRCRECRYCKKKRGTFKGEPITFYRCEENNRDVESDDYCSWGERSSE